MVLIFTGYASTTIFANPAHNDFRLKVGSPLLAHGANLTADPVLAINSDYINQPRPAAGAWDIGADEFYFQVIPGATTATVIWQTASPSTSEVDYGLTSGYGLASSSAASVTLHTINLKGLTANTIYHFQIVGSTNGDAIFQLWMIPRR